MGGRRSRLPGILTALVVLLGGTSLGASAAQAVSTVAVRGVVDVAGVPIAGVLVLVASVDDANHRQTVTDADGRYLVSGLRKGARYQIRVDDTQEPWRFWGGWRQTDGTLSASDDPPAEIFVARKGLAPRNVHISGDPAVQVGSLTIDGPHGQKPRLSAVVNADGGWGPAPVRFTYQWLRDSWPIAGATKAHYQLRAVDHGSMLTVVVTGWKHGHGYGQRAAELWLPLRTFAASPTPRASGNARVGMLLEAKIGRWKPAARIAYQWNRNAQAIPGATNRKYRLTAADRGAAITVTVTGSRVGYASVTLSSAPTATVA